jgi:RHS repeat-associated protein
VRSRSITLPRAGDGDPRRRRAYAHHHGSLLDIATELQLKSQGPGGGWYAADLGRFISEDPIQDGSNWYAFAGNNPVVYADPTGLYQQGHPLQGGSRAFDNSIRQLVNNPTRTAAPTRSTSTFTSPITLATEGSL